MVLNYDPRPANRVLSSAATLAGPKQPSTQKQLYLDRKERLQSRTFLDLAIDSRISALA